MDFFKLVAEVGFPIAAAMAAGYFVFLTLKFILQGVTGSTGYTGVTGSTGSTGYTGVTGSTGYTGGTSYTTVVKTYSGTGCLDYTISGTMGIHHNFSNESALWSQTVNAYGNPFPSICNP